jgi:hypothetical protein
MHRRLLDGRQIHVGAKVEVYWNMKSEDGTSLNGEWFEATVEGIKGDAGSREFRLTYADGADIWTKFIATEWRGAGAGDAHRTK